MRHWKKLCLALAACALCSVGHAQSQRPAEFVAITVTAASTTSLRVFWALRPAMRNSRIVPTSYFGIEYRKRTESSWTYVPYVSAKEPITSATLRGLTTGDVYVIRVGAVDLHGLATVSGQYIGVPEAVVTSSLAVTAAVASASSVRVSWTPSPSTLSATGYNVLHQGGTSQWSSQEAWVSRSLSGGTVRSATLTGLTPGKTYAVRVCARTTARRAPCGLAWATPDEKPGRPAAPAVTIANRTSLRVSWSAPSNSGSAITDYDVRYRASGASSWTSHDFTGTGTATTITGLTTGTTYSVQVRAGNSWGESNYSPSATATPNEKPGRPAAPTASVASGTSLRVSWTAPTNNGTAITGYDVRYKRSSSSTWSSHAFTGTGKSTTITGLTAGVAYDVQVRAGNAVGKGLYSPSSSGTPDAKPGRPAYPSVAPAAATSVNVFWSAPANTGSAITGYDVRYQRSSSSTWSSHTFTGTDVFTTITELTTGATYNVQVRAGNKAGKGAWSPSGSGVPSGKPDRPAAPSVSVASGTSLRVSWIAPANNGSAIGDYDVNYKRSSSSSWSDHSFIGAGTATTITGLTAGVTYDVRVRAGNIVGESAYSPSGSGTPDAKPGRPAAPSVAPGGTTSLSVSWTAPTNTGSAITDYDVRYKQSSSSTWESHAFTGTGKSTTITGLTTGVTYNVQVRAGNRAGKGAWSPSGSGVPSGKPDRPAAPSVSVASGTSLRVSWIAPANNGSAIGDYDVNYKRSSSSSWSDHSFIGAGTATTITGLTAGVTYDVRVRAGNIVGESAYSPSGSGTPDAKPGRPAAPSVAPGGTTSLSVSWTAPTNTGSAITDYDVRYKRSSSSTWKSRTFTGTGKSTIITRLTTGATYNVQVRAGNSAGESEWSPSGSGTPNVVPGRPAAPSVSVASGTSLRVSWIAPVNNGTAITDYDVRYKRSSSSTWSSHAFTGRGKSTTITGLTAGVTYHVQVRAGNSAGEGEWSLSGRAASIEGPGRPAAPSVSVASATSLRISWTAPASGGSAITDYDVRYKRSSSSTWSSHAFTGRGKFTTITGLTAGVAYDVQVRAGNAVGKGPYSPSSSGTPDAKPGRPAAPSVAPGSATSLSVSWTAPTNTGSAITDYDVRYKQSTSSTWSSHNFTGTGKSTTITGLTTDITYNVQVRAGNAAGKGNWSASGSGTPADVPDAPQFTASYHFGSHAIVLNFGRCPRHGCMAGFYEIEETFNGSTSVARPYGTEYRRLNPAAGTYRFRARDCSIADQTNKVCGAWSAKANVVVGGTGPFASEPALATSTTPGNLPYDLGVTKGGDAYVNIPVVPAPGVNGLAPRLAIAYGGGRERQLVDRDDPADILGYGWRISGLSAIHRCNKNTSNANVVLTSADSLCLDGEPLVVVSKEKWADGAEYRTYRESFVKVVANGTGAAQWFEAKLPNGTTRQYGNTADSRLLVATGVNYAWSVNRETDAFGNAMTFEYHEDEDAKVRQPSRIVYGNSGDAELQFVYAARADATTTGGARTRRLLLHTVRAVLDGRKVREYRLLSETATQGWRRLDKAQLCGFDENGANPQCLAALDVDWIAPLNAPVGYKTCVSGVTDPMGRATTFEYVTVTNGGTAGLFTERPFGEVGTPADADEWAVARGAAVKPVVSAVIRGNGIGGVNREEYAYQGLPYRGKRNWGLLGFAATRVKDATNGVVTYLRHRLDDPHFGERAEEHRYDKVYGATAKTLSKRLLERSSTTLTHTFTVNGATRTATTKVPHVAAETVVRYENGTALGAMRTASTPAFSSNLPTRTTRTTVVGRGTEGARSAGWGNAPAYAFTSTLRKHVATRDLRNRTAGANWLVGFVCQATEAHHRSDASSAERTLWTAFTPSGNTVSVASARRFGTADGACSGLANSASGVAGLALTTAVAYDANGNPTSETVSGGNVASRTTTASAYADARWPGRLANALDHAETVVYDARFGLPKTVTDANGRVTETRYDPFGRLASLTDPDGVAFTVRRAKCGAGIVCPASVDGVAPAVAVRITSPATPDETRFLDKLGRVVRVATEAFSGSNDIHADTRHDARGRVLRRSAPHFAGGDAPNTAYEYDNLDRVTKETRPDGGETSHAYAAGTGGATVVTTTEKAYKGATLDATLTARAIHNLLGEVESVEEARGSASAVTTTHTYDASGLLLTTTVGTTRVATFAYDAAGNRASHASPNSGTTAFTHTALGELRTRRDALGNTATWTYDLLGRRTSRSDPDGKALWTYDPANGKGLLHRRCQGPAALTGCAAGPEFAETLSYGTDARPSSAAAVIRADGQAARTYTRRFGYDSSGRLSTVAHPSGATTLRDYNSRGYLSAVRDNATKAALETYTGMDAFGNVTGVTHGNGALTTRTFDAKTGRQTAVKTTHGAGSAKVVAQDFGYSWRSDGLLASRSTGSGASKRTETFSRDAQGRLTRAAVSGSGGRRLDYGYDALGSLLNRASNVTADADAALSGHSAAATAAPGPHAPRFATVGSERAGLAYDAAGRMTGRTVCAESSGDACTAKSGADHRFVAWSARDLPTRVVVGSGLDDAAPTVREDFAHGPDGVRHFRKTRWREGGAEMTERRYAVGRFEEVVPASASSTHEWVRKTLVTDGVLHVRRKPRGGAETSRYEHLHRDHLGSVAAVTGASGAVSRQAAHDPFGARRATDWTRAQTRAERAAWADGADVHTSRGFAAHDQLDRTGLVDMGGRVYDPELGMFLSPDPVVANRHSAQDWNPYAYVGNRPLSRVDPTGFTWAPVDCGAGWAPCLGGGMAGGGFSGGVEPVISVVLQRVWRLRFNVDFGWDGYRLTYWWQPELRLSMRVDGARSRDDSQPGDEPLFTGRDWISIGVGALPVAGTGQSVVELITGRDPITDEKVHRGVAAAGIFAGVVPGGKALLKVGVKAARKLAARRTAKIVLRRPAGIPDDWKARPTKGGKGVQYDHPTNKHHYVRVMRGNPSSQYRNSRRPYVRVQAHGQARDVHGNIVPKRSEAAHIPVEDFRFDIKFFEKK